MDALQHRPGLRSSPQRLSRLHLCAHVTGRQKRTAKGGGGVVRPVGGVLAVQVVRQTTHKRQLDALLEVLEAAVHARRWDCHDGKQHQQACELRVLLQWQAEIGISRQANWGFLLLWLCDTSLSLLVTQFIRIVCLIQFGCLWHRRQQAWAFSSMLSLLSGCTCAMRCRPALASMREMLSVRYVRHTSRALWIAIRPASLE